MLRAFAFRIGLAVACSAGVAQLAAAQAPGYSSLPASDAAQPAAFYSPQYAMAQGAAYPAPQRPMMAQRPVYATASNAYAPPSAYMPNGVSGGSYGAMPRTMATASNGSPTLASPAPSAAPAGGLAATPMGATSAEAWGGEGGIDGAWRRGGRGVDMPQHYPYYPPMHGYYYFRPYHYTHVPAQQGFATQFGVDPRNPYSNDFFKVVYAEFRASLIRTSPEQVGAPAVETPTEILKKLKALKDEGTLSQEEFDAKKAEILGRM